MSRFSCHVMTVAEVRCTCQEPDMQGTGFVSLSRQVSIFVLALIVVGGSTHSPFTVVYPEEDVATCRDCHTRVATRGNVLMDTFRVAKKRRAHKFQRGRYANGLDWARMHALLSP